MVDLKILQAFGSTRERLREVFTATNLAESPRKGESKAEKEERIERNTQRARDVELRAKLEALIQSRIMTGIQFSLKNHRPYAAVDLAWDSNVLTKVNMPLLLYAQGKIDVQRAANLLKSLPDGESYINRNADQKPTGINLPRFIESEVNMIRSMINRRWAAQKNKYSNLWPYYNFESRSTGLPGKCRADVLSQRADIMVDQFGIRAHDAQVILDGLLFAHSVDFVRSSWEVEKQLRYKEDGTTESYITKEGLGWLNSHPSRTFWDRAHALPTINSDTGCDHIGCWDVVKYGNVENEPFYFNKDCIGYGTNFWGGSGLYTQYLDYFNQYNYVINPPSPDNAGNAPLSLDVAGMNDSKSYIGNYSHSTRDAAMFITNYFQKLVPKEWGLGDYPFPVWMRVVYASDSTPIFAEFLPSRPCAVLSINENNARAVSISMAMDIMQYQQQMTNLLTSFMKLIQVEAFKAIGINTDALEEEQIKKIESILASEDWYSDPLVYRFSLAKKLEQLGIAPSKAMTEVITVSEARQGQSINTIFDAMIKLLQLAERMQAMSAAESGQSEPREISATQTNVIANTTQSVYSSISDCIDDFREAKKQIIYESLVSCSEGEINVPVKSRYTVATIRAAGFEPVSGEDEDFSSPAKRRTVIGSAKSLVHEYIFSSRDGSERAVNTQAANTLVQLIAQVLAVPDVVQALGREKIYSMFNEVFRMSGAGVDLNIELAEGETDSMGQNEIMQLKQTVDEIGKMLQQLAQQTQKNATDIAGQAQVNEEQQQHIDLNAQLADQVRKLAEQLQQIEQEREKKIQIPELKYSDAPPSIRAQIERMNGLEPANASERIATKAGAV